MNGLELGILDFCNVYGAMQPDDALWATFELAPKVEALGYSRYWLTEHHTTSVAHASPEVLLPVLGGLTSTIRLGTAGVLLNFYSPYKVASNFRLLHTIFPNRIDLGIARAPVHSLIEPLLRVGNQGPPFPEKLSELLSYLRGTAATAVTPLGTAPPEIWLLGSKSRSLELAAAQGTCFCLSLFIGSPLPESPHLLLDSYREKFVPSPELPEPKWAVAFAGVCAESEGEAQRVAAAYGPSVSPFLIGTPEYFAESLQAMRELYQTSLFIFLDMNRTFAGRLRSYQLLAEGLRLRTESVPPAS